ncbi:MULTISPECIES: hypothetical protein [unclassified Streptomyces]|uniref:hypothetical protein n=1 Tax=unclassified Streptomyces TaxID=2593676 RepID=UPI000DC7B9F2|nr:MULTISPECIES: hypothetical protein [unclassified Streptomyces]AWZ08445.1 hypothetical protein DRB89_32000 [Streptomyces sp. ICC4]AWZ13870.1 hypothetical protein DRB96_17965 [Streptomyces sp. ICC1]
MQKPPSQPELPDRVPEKRDAVTPDLPPFGPGAPDLPDAERGRARRDGPERTGSEENGGSGNNGPEAGERPAAGPGNAKPQEPTD